MERHQAPSGLRSTEGRYDRLSAPCHVAGGMLRSVRALDVEAVGDQRAYDALWIQAG